MLGQNYFAEPNQHVSFCCALSIYTKMLAQNHFGEPNQYVSFCCTLYLSPQSVQKCWGQNHFGQPNRYFSFCCALYLPQQSVLKCWAKTILCWVKTILLSQTGMLAFFLCPLIVSAICTKMLGQNHFAETNRNVSFCCALY